jgi:hypothetical protein
MGKVLVLWSNGEEHHILPPICALILKSTPSVLIILIRVIRIVICKVCKSSSVRGMQIPYLKGKKIEKSRKKKYIYIEKEKKTYGLPSRFLYACFMFLISLSRVEYWLSNAILCM